MLTLDFKPLRSYVKGEHAAGKDLESSCMRKETLDIGILIKSRNGDKNIMQPTRIKSRPNMRMIHSSTA